MKFYLAIIFSMLLSDGLAQVEDHFTDGDFSSSPTWTGSAPDFIVNSTHQLQLNATVAGNSMLTTSSNLSSLDSCEWRLFIHLNFSPSTSNNARFYLASDNPDLTQPLNGYFLQFGESLSNDAIELFRQTGSTTTSICRATDGLIANSFMAGIKIFRSSNAEWTLSVDYNGGINYLEEASGIDTTYDNAAFVGINCLYTSGNITKFYFDDIYAGPIIYDTIPPLVTAINIESDSIVSIIFSEMIESNSLNDLSNYLIDNGIGNPIQIFQDNNDSLKYSIKFQNHFIAGQNYLFSLTGLRDAAQNIIITCNHNFVYYPFAQATKNDVMFSEIYFEPSSSSPLPNAEYIEVYNRTNAAISISGWTISDGNDDGVIADYFIPPNDFVVLHDESDSMEFIGIHGAVNVSGFPTLNNDAGDHIILSDSNGIIINELNFSDGNYHDSNKDASGWSIERIDREFTCKDVNNWKASASSLHGTPGSLNNVDGTFNDGQKPFALSAFFTDSSSIRIIFSEGVINADNPANYLLNDESGNSFQPASAQLTYSDDTAIIYFPSVLGKGILTLHVSNTVTDCPGNTFDQQQNIRLGFPETASRGDLILNEILFNPFEGGSDFLELYNCSQKIIDLKGWGVTEATFEDSMDIRESSVISTEHRLIFPGQFLVLTENKEEVKRFYLSDEYSFLDLSSMVDFNSDEGTVIINDENGNTIDDFSYNEDMHFPLIVDPKGVSLERLTENEKIYWHSAAATAGFATPGFRNSQWIGKFSGEEEVSVGEDVFSPDNDGHLDVLPIHYAFAHSGTVLSLNVFDSYGQPVRTILDGQTVETEGDIVWDGITDDNLIAPVGIYIILAKSFDLEGNNSSFKKAVFLTRKM